MTRVSHVTDPTPFCKSLMHLGSFIFATRSEAKKVIFWALQNHGILRGRTFLDFCVFRKTGDYPHKKARTAAPETTRRMPDPLVILDKSAPKKKKRFCCKKTCFFTDAENKKIRGGKSDARQRRAKHCYLPDLCLFLHFFTEKLPTGGVTNGFDTTAEGLRRRIFRG